MQEYFQIEMKFNAWKYGFNIVEVPVIFTDRTEGTSKMSGGIFFEAVIGGASVGTPATLKTLKKIHKDYGKLEWSEIIKPVIKLSSEGFIPPNRLVNALKKEKFLYLKTIVSQLVLELIINIQEQLET